MFEEILPFYSILIPFFLKNRFNCILSVASIYMVSMIGNMFYTINPFVFVIASDSTSINFKDSMYFRLININIIIIDGNIILYFYRYYKK